MANDADLLSIFWVEVSEYLESLNAALLKVEMVSGEEAHALLREMNRVAHSMKGAARAVGISVIETIAHYMEEVFSAALDGGLKLSPDVCDTLYDGLDLIQNVMGGQDNNPETVATVLTRLEQVVTGNAPSEDVFDDDDSPVSKNKSTQTAEHKVNMRETPAIELPVVSVPVIKTPEMLDAQTMMLRPAEETIRVTVSKLDKLMAEASELLVLKMHSEERQRRAAHLRRFHTRWQREWRTVRSAYIRLVRRLQEQHDEGLASDLALMFKFLEANQRHLSDSNRELAQLGQLMAQDNMQLSALADQLQDDIGAMRLMPFDTIVGGFQRMVRDLARDTGKQIVFEVIGASVEIDKTVLDALKDPLMHVLRNAIDHGIEAPAARERAGKAPSGRLELIVEQRGSEIVLRVEDDGQGIDPNRVRRAAVRQGLLTEQEANAIGDDEIKSYIFYSGLTTTDHVTALSGRGVGMDIVRDRIEGLRGRVSVHSVIGQGTTITFNVPVSLTRLRCILLSIGHEEYAVPSVMVMRMESIPRSQVFTAEGRDMILVNDRPMPLVSLGTILDVPPAETSEPSEVVPVLALRGADRAVAFEVDTLYSEQELVLKPLGRELARAAYVAGAALLGSGSVIIVLDANDLVRKASGAVLPRRRADIFTPNAAQRRLRVLVVDDSITTRTLEKNILETAGFDVYVAIDGVEAWAKLTDIDFDVVISDVEMPNMNGLELTRRIKDHPQTKSIPVILLTSLGKPEQKEAGLRAGADAYLVKSRFDQSELLETIQAMV